MPDSHISTRTLLAASVGDTSDAWDLDDTCPSYWIFSPDLRVTTADASSLDWEEITAAVPSR